MNHDAPSGARKKEESRSEGVKEIHLEFLQVDFTTIDYFKWKMRFLAIRNESNITGQDMHQLLTQSVCDDLTVEMCRGTDIIKTWGMLDIMFKATNWEHNAEEYLRTITQDKGESVRAYFFRMQQAFNMFPWLNHLFLVH